MGRLVLKAHLGGVMTNLPLDIELLLDRQRQGESFSFYHFYGHKPPVCGVDASCLSQWFVHSFSVDGVEYRSAEHWMMAEKARLFDDGEALELILECETPREAKALGRKVRDFDAKLWGDKCFDIVLTGNRAKFGQSDELKEFLTSTAFQGRRNQVESDSSSFDTQIRASNSMLAAEESETYATSANRELSASILVESAPRDRIWGIGLGAKNEKALDPSQWRGRNLLGFVLTQVREELRGAL